MRKVKNPTDSSAFLGQKMTFRKTKRQVIVSNRPDYVVDDPSTKQEDTQRKFREAAHYATQQIADADSLSLYEARVTDKLKTARIVAMTDYLNPPKVVEIRAIDYAGKVGNIIGVKADDDFMVTRVKIVITGSDGQVLEEGEAKQDPKTLLDWNYVATTANPSLGGTKIRAIAFDRPGNTAELEKEL